MSTTAPADDYPDDWAAIATAIKEAAGWCCERCREPHNVERGYVLTVHHLDGVKANCQAWNLAALCQRCHLKIQARIRMDQLFMDPILPVSDWFKPHLDGYLKSKEVATGSAVGGEFYSGIEWFACWLLDRAEGKTITEEQLRLWAVEAWKTHLKQRKESPNGLGASGAQLQGRDLDAASRKISKPPNTGGQR